MMSLLPTLAYIPPEWIEAVPRLGHPVIIGIYNLFALLVGLCIGSFLNVCIYRIPLDASLSHPGSHCAACGSPIPWYHNIPVLSWWILRGRAACCGTRIDWRYWLVEALTGVLFLVLWMKYPPAQFAVYALFCSGLLVSSCIDMDHYIIPDRFTLGGVVAGLICSTAVPSLQGETTYWGGFTESLRGAFIGAFVLYAVSKFGTWVLRKDAMGLGDVKFLAAMGAFLGAMSLSFIIPASALFGCLFGLGVIFGRQGGRGTQMPYGPFLALAAAIWLFGGREATQEYWRHAFGILMPPEGGAFEILTR